MSKLSTSFFLTLTDMLRADGGSVEEGQLARCPAPASWARGQEKWFRFIRRQTEEAVRRGLLLRAGGRVSLKVTPDQKDASIVAGLTMEQQMSAAAGNAARLAVLTMLGERGPMSIAQMTAVLAAKSQEVFAGTSPEMCKARAFILTLLEKLVDLLVQHGELKKLTPLRATTNEPMFALTKEGQAAFERDVPITERVYVDPSRIVPPDEGRPRRVDLDGLGL